MSQQLQNQAPPAPSRPGRMTYEQFLARMDEDAHVEWVDGEAIAMAPISGQHQDIGAFLISVLREFVIRRKLGAVQYEPFQMKPGPSLPGRSPDILFVATANLARLKPTHLDGPADLVVEIISPESRERDRGQKFYEYQEAGIPEYWLIDPERKQAIFYLLGEDRIYRPADIGRDGIFRSIVLKGLWLRVNWLWQRPALMDVLKEWGEA